MDDRQSGIAYGCDPRPSGSAFKIAGPGCRRQRHSSGAWECTRTQRLDQRSQRHRRCGQSAGDTAAGHKPGSHTHLIPSYRWLPNVAGATSRQDETNATCGEIPSLGDPSGRQGARQAAQRQDSKHLQGMLNPHLGLARCKEYRPHPEELAKQASRRMDATQGTRSHPSRRAQGALLKDEVGDATVVAGRRRYALIAHPIGFSPASICARRGSRNGGSASFSPSVSIGSTVAKPGPSVAISNRMPLGSRKYRLRK